MWKTITMEAYHDALEILPPATVTAHGFLQGEPFDFRTCSVTGGFTAVYAAYIEHNGRYYGGPHLSLAEFRKVDPREVARSAQQGG